MKLTTLVAASTGALLLCAAPAAAQVAPAASSTKGFFIGAHANGSSLTSDDFLEDTESGGGAGLHLGWGFTPRLALFSEGTAAILEDDIAFAHFDIGLRYSWTGPTRRFVPSVEAAFTGRAIGSEDVVLEDGSTADEVSLSGSGFTIGGGVQYFFSPKLALLAQLKWTGGEFSRFKVDNVSIDDLDIDGTSTRINVGLTWYPMGGR